MHKEKKINTVLGGLKVEHWTNVNKSTKCAIEKNTPKQASVRSQADNSSESREGDTDEDEELSLLKVSDNNVSYILENKEKSHSNTRFYLKR